MVYCSLSEAYGKSDWSSSGSTNPMTAPLQPGNFCTNDPYFDSQQSKGKPAQNSSENIIDKFNDLERKIEAFTQFDQTAIKSTPKPSLNKSKINERLENILHYVLISIFSALMVENLFL